MFINLSILLIHVIIISRWHRLGISVKGNSVTAIIDCKKQQNREIKREAKDTIIHDGIILLAQQIDDNTFFEVCFFLFQPFQEFIPYDISILHITYNWNLSQGDLQQLTIVDNPQAAYELCTDYVPDCNEPLPALAAGKDVRSQLRYYVCMILR